MECERSALAAHAKPIVRRIRVKTIHQKLEKGHREKYGFSFSFPAIGRSIAGFYAMETRQIPQNLP
jgi:hypothetical protein